MAGHCQHWFVCAQSASTGCALCCVLCILWGMSVWCHYAQVVIRFITMYLSLCCGERWGGESERDASNRTLIHGQIHDRPAATASPCRLHTFQNILLQHFACHLACSFLLCFIFTLLLLINRRCFSSLPSEDGQRMSYGGPPNEWDVKSTETVAEKRNTEKKREKVTK